MGNRDIAKRTDRIIVVVLCVLACALVGWLVVGNMQAAEDQAAGDSPAKQEGTDDAAQSVSSFDGKRAGVITGSFQDGVVERHLPHSTRRSLRKSHAGAFWSCRAQRAH